MSWVLGIAGIGVWMAYLAFAPLIAKVCAAGRAWLRVFYWWDRPGLQGRRLPKDSILMHILDSWVD
jgi:hypothetical protein